MSNATLAILGAGNIGRAIATGLAGGLFQPADIILTRRKPQHLDDLTEAGFQVQSDNRDAVRRAEIIILTVEPQQLNPLLEEIADKIHDLQRRVVQYSRT